FQRITTSRRTSRGTPSRRSAGVRCAPARAGMSPASSASLLVNMPTPYSNVGTAPRAVRVLVHRAADRDPQPAHAPIKIRPVGLEPPRGLRDVAAGHRQRARDQRAFVVVERVAQGMIEERGIGK